MKLALADLDAGEEGRVLRVAIEDSLCRRRLAELGIAEGMVVRVSGTGDTMMLALGTSRFGLARSCAERIAVVRIKK
jgi:Fe2+ transport system protein FeoA